MNVQQFKEAFQILEKTYNAVKQIGDASIAKQLEAFELSDDTTTKIFYFTTRPLKISSVVISKQ